jgi:hypothetical protein
MLALTALFLEVRGEQLLLAYLRSMLRVTLVECLPNHVHTRFVLDGSGGAALFPHK